MKKCLLLIYLALFSFFLNAQNILSELNIPDEVEMSPELARLDANKNFRDASPISIDMDNSIVIETKSGDTNFSFIIWGDGVAMIMNNDYAGHVVVPETIEQDGVIYTVTGIHDFAFSNCPDLLSISLPSTINTISMIAFDYSSQLSAINVDENNPVYGSFNGILCDADKSIIYRVPEGFEGDLQFPASFQNIDSYSFYYCIKVNSVDFSLTSISQFSNYIFTGCTELTEVEFPLVLLKIGSYLFSNCPSLVELNLPASLENFSIPLYYRMHNLETLRIAEDNSRFKTIDNALYSIDGNTLYLVAPQSAKDTYIIKDDVKSVYTYTFTSCNELTNIILPENLLFIRYGFILDCQNIHTLDIHKNVSSIGQYLSVSCPNFKAINVHADNPYYYSDDGVVYKKDYPSLITCPQGYEGTEFIVPEGIDSIMHYAFRYNIHIENFVLPSTLKYLGFCAIAGSNYLYKHQNEAVYVGDWFYGFFGAFEPDYELVIKEGVVGMNQQPFTNGTCGYLAHLKYIRLPSTLKYMNMGAFYQCTWLQEIHIPEGVENIPSYAFCLCYSLKEVHLPSTIKTVENNFVFYACNELKDLYSYASDPPEIIFDFDPVMADYTNCNLHIYSDSYDKYRQAYVWKEFLNYYLMEPTSILDVPENSAFVVRTEYFTVDGRQIIEPSVGAISIKREYMSDGSVRSSKISHLK